MMYDINDVATNLECIGTFCYIMVAFHENKRKLGEDAISIDNDSYLKLFSMISNTIYSEKDKLTMIADDMMKQCAVVKGNVE